jgi:hypothetical protein
LGKFADVAQLVEQLIRNQQVSGSSPLIGSTNTDREIKQLRLISLFGSPIVYTFQVFSTRN